MNLLKKRIVLFEMRQNQLREKFKKLPLFNFDCENVYEIIDKENLEILDYEKQLETLEESSQLFEVTLPEFKAIKQVLQLKLDSHCALRYSYSYLIITHNVLHVNIISAIFEAIVKGINQLY